MNRTALLLLVTLCFAPMAVAQFHGEAGVFAEYLRSEATGTNHGGLGARLAINLRSYLQLEAEGSYDFKRGFQENFNTGVPGNFTIANSNVKIIQGLFGPKLQTPNRAFRLFGTLKGGFISFGFDRGSGLTGVTSAINNLRSDNTNGVFYPGGGVEFYLGPIGLRGDAGDVIYWNNGPKHNFRATFGPHFQF